MVDRQAIRGDRVKKFWTLQDRMGCMLFWTVFVTIPVLLVGLVLVFTGIIK